MLLIVWSTTREDLSAQLSPIEAVNFQSEKMQQRKTTTAAGRPSGTDGSDFSYRMVVDSRESYINP